ncbi:MAG: ATP-binding protein [Ferruginibacter sp.]
MKSINNISIRNKLVLMQVFTSILVLSIFFAAFIITDIRDYKQRKVASMLSLAQVIGTNSIPTLEFQDDEAARNILLELKNVAPEITHAAITDKNGKIFASYSKTGEQSFRLPEDFKTKRFEFFDKSLLVKNDIISNDQKSGEVYIEAELSELQDIKKTKYGIVTLSLFVAIITCVLIALLVQSYISKRLLYLVNTIKNVSKTGNYNTSIADDGRDEIGVLTRAYNDLMQQVVESQQKKDEFIGVASHELKTPLTSIKGYLELLTSVEDRQPNKQFVQKANENVLKLERLIKDLLDVSKIQSGQLELNISKFNISSLVDEAIASFQIISSSHSISREGDCTLLMIEGDRQRIEQVLINLLSNAIKYSPNEKDVIVYCRKNEQYCIIQIRDFGKGIPAEDQSKIFERFYRAKDTSPYISGFGLGLYICWDIINRHKGKIWMEPEEKGSSFYISLPLN